MSKQATKTGPTKLKRRIVLYGRPSSGKTCFLAALAMARLPHPSGYACTWINDSQNIPKPPGKREEWDAHDPVVARYLGREWLQKSIDLLNAGDVPYATPNDVTPYRLLFDLTVPDGRIIRLEMIDYSGELVDPNLAQDVLAKQLIQHLEDSDGVLVLAEAPKGTSNSDEAELQAYGQHKELQVLQQALMLVAEKRRKGRAEPIPMGMLLNKWDRFSKTDHYDEAAISIEKDIFMQRNPPVPQRVLLNVLKAVAGFVDEESYCESFAVSAFGQTKTVSKPAPNGKQRQVEAPKKLFPLRSYGLEDPLIWVCDKADLLELREFGMNVKRLRTWKLWHVPARRALRVRSEILKVRKLLPDRLERSRTLNRLAGEALGAFFRQCAFAMVFVGLMLLGAVQWGVYGYDSMRYTRIYPSLKAAENNSPADEWAEQWKEAESFLASYAKPAWFRVASHYGLLSADSAREMLAGLQPRMAEATKILAIRDEFDKRLDGFVQVAAASHDEAKLESIRDEVRALAVPSKYVAGGAKKEAALARISLRQQEVLHAKMGEDVRRKYRDCLASSDLAKAAEILAANERQAPQIVAELKSEFQKSWYDILSRDVKDRSENEKWPAARRAIDDLENSPEASRLTGPNGRLKCSELRARVDKHQRERVYSNWYYNQANPLRLAQVREHGSAADRDAVAAWKAYEDFRNEPRYWKIHMTGLTNNDLGNNGKAALTRTTFGFYNPNYATGWSKDLFMNNGYASTEDPGAIVTGKYEDSITVSVHYETPDYTFPALATKAKWTGSIRELCSGAKQRIVTQRYGYPEVHFRATLTTGSIPPMPSLRVPPGGPF